MRPFITLTLAATSCALLTTGCAINGTSASATATPATSAAGSTAPTASASRSASAASSSSPAHTQSPTGTAVATQTSTEIGKAAVGLPDLVQKYCTKTQKVCFNYPANYVVVSNATNAGGMPGEQGHVDDPQGKPVLYFADGIGGVGGGCDAASQKDQTIVESLPTKITGLATTSQYDATDVHLVSVVIQPTSGGYVPQQYLSRAKAFASAGTVHTCGEAFSDLIMLPGGKGSVHVGIYQFADQNSQQHLDSLEAARQAFGTVPYMLAAAIMETVTIG